MKIKQKLLLTFSLFLLIFAIFGAINYFVANQTEESLDLVVETFDDALLPSIDSLDEIGHLRHAVDEVRLKAYEFLLKEPGAKEEFLLSLDHLAEARDTVFLNPVIMSYVDQEIVGQMTVSQVKFANDVIRFSSLAEEGQHEEAVAVIQNEMEPVLEMIDLQLTDFEISIDRHVEKSGNSFNQLIVDIRDRLGLVEKVMIGLFLLGVLGVFFLGQRVGNDLLLPILLLADVAGSIENEQYELNSLDSIVDRSDELGQLARMMKKMGVEVIKREDALKREVVQLRIQIDQSRRSEDVEKITTTDEFQDLQAKARAARAARRAKEQENKE